MQMLLYSQRKQTLKRFKVGHRHTADKSLISFWLKYEPTQTAAAVNMQAEWFPEKDWSGNHRPGLLLSGLVGESDAWWLTSY